jgi:uncharacterized protein (DUF433 family)
MLRAPQTEKRQKIHPTLRHASPASWEKPSPKSKSRPKGRLFIVDVQEELPDNFKMFDRITHDPQIMSGKPTIRGTRVTVGVIVAQIDAGRSIDEVLVDYPYLSREDVLEAVRYAAWRTEKRETDLAAS